MLKIKICIYTIFIILNANNAYAVSFDCNKASRASEKAICSNMELSVLDDELSVAFKKAILISPDIKSSQREWIKATRLCESNMATLNSCIKSAYISQIEILTNKKIATKDTHAENLVKESETKKNDIAVVNNLPVKPLQQQTPQSLPPSQTNKPELEIFKNTLILSSQQSNIKQVEAVSIASSFFNLKEFNLNMKKMDVKRLIPNAKPQILDPVGGKEWSGFQCGVIVQQSPSSCNFTYAGEEITAISVSFWDNRVYEIQFYFGPYRPREHKGSTVDLNFKMRMAFDTKYPKQSNGKVDGTPGGSGSKWKSGNEELKVEYVEDKNFLSNSISLSNPSFHAQLLSAEAKHSEVKQKNDKTKHDKKLLSDM